MESFKNPTTATSRRPPGLDQTPQSSSKHDNSPGRDKSHKPATNHGRTSQSNTKQHQQLHQELQQQLQQRQQQQQQQQQGTGNPSPPQALSLHIRSQPSPPTKPKSRHYDEIKQSGKHKKHQGKELQSKRTLHNLHVNPPANKPHSLTPSPHNPTAEVNATTSSHVVTSQPKTLRGKGKKLSNNNATASSSTSGNKKKSNSRANPAKSKDKQHKDMKPSRNSVGALEAGVPERFCATPDNKETNSTKTKQMATKKKRPNHDLTNIPQTNLSVGLIVFCCFNPVFGVVAIYFSLMAAKEFRNGHEAKGYSRANWSILVSLFGITVTMVIVSTLVVVFAVGNHSNSQIRQTAAHTFGF